MTGLNRFRLALLGLICLCASTAYAVTPPCPLTGSRDDDLQSRLDQVLRRLELMDAVQEGRLSVALAILDDPAHPRLAEANGARMFYAASLPKIAILLGAAVELDRGVLDMDEQLDADLNDMIRQSCNACATRVLDRVGRERLIEILQDPGFRFYEPEGDGGLWVGKPYGPEPAYHRGPVAGKSHGANALQVVRFYCALNAGELVSEKQNAMMLNALRDPGIHHKFVRALDLFETEAVYRKSGTWKGYHADSAMVVAGDRTYVMVALAHDPAGSRWLERLGGALHMLATAWQDSGNHSSSPVTANSQR
jgi:beta-lactamase class A